jgi:hypothetical protein
LLSKLYSNLFIKPHTFQSTGSHYKFLANNPELGVARAAVTLINFQIFRPIREFCRLPLYCQDREILPLQEILLPRDSSKSLPVPCHFKTLATHYNELIKLISLEPVENYYFSTQ